MPLHTSLDQKSTSTTQHPKYRLTASEQLTQPFSALQIFHPTRSVNRGSESSYYFSWDQKVNINTQYRVTARILESGGHDQIGLTNSLM